MKHLPLSNDCINKVGIAIKLILNHIVEHFQEKEYQMMIGRVGKKEPRRAKSLQKV